MTDNTILFRLEVDETGAVAGFRIARADLEKLSQETTKTGTAARSGAQGVKALGDETERTGKRAVQTTGVMRELKGIVATLFTVATVRQAIEYADTMKNIDARLRIVTSSQEELNRAQAEIPKIANETFSSLQATAELYTRTAFALKDQKVAQEDILQVTRTLNQAYQVSGATTQEAYASVIQLSQAFASGALRGDEFRSVMEQAPRVVQALTDSLGLTRGELRELANDGQLTTQVIVKALLEQGQTIDQEFSNIQVTVGRAFTVLRNNIQSYIGDADKANGSTKAIADGVLLLANNLNTVVNVAIAATSAGLVIYVTNAARAEAVTFALGRAFVFMTGPIGIVATAIGLLTFEYLESAENAKKLNDAMDLGARSANDYGTAIKNMTAEQAKANLETITAAAVTVNLALIRAQESLSTFGDPNNPNLQSNPLFLQQVAEIKELENTLSGLQAQYHDTSVRIKELTDDSDAATQAQRQQASAAELLAAAMGDLDEITRKHNDAVKTAESVVTKFGTAQQQIAIINKHYDETLQELRAQLGHNAADTDLLAAAEAALVIARNKSIETAREEAAVTKDMTSALNTAEAAIAKLGTAEQRKALLTKQFSATVKELQTELGGTPKYADLLAGAIEALTKEYYDNVAAIDHESDAVFKLHQSMNELVRQGVDPVTEQFMLLDLMLEEAEAQLGADSEAFKDLAEQVLQLKLNVEGLNTEGPKIKQTLVEFETFQTAFARGIERLDDLGANLWKSWFTGAKNAMQAIKDYFLNWLAELANAAITRPILVSIAASLGLGGTKDAAAASGIPGIGAVGGLNSLLPGLGLLGLGVGAGSLIGGGGTGSIIGSAVGAFAGQLGYALGIGPLTTILGGVIGGAIGGLFDKNNPLKLSVAGTAAAAQNPYASGHDLSFETALGEVFVRSKRIADEDIAQLQNSITEFDNTVAQFLTEDQLSEASARLKTWSAQMEGAAISVEDLIKGRFQVVLSTLSEEMQAYIGEVAGLPEQVQRLALATGAQQIIDAAPDLFSGWTFRQLISVFEDLQHSGESMTDTYVRLAQSTQLMENALNVMGVDFGKTGEEFIRFAADFTDAAGSIDRAADLWSKYFETFYSADELLNTRLIQAQKDALDQLGDVGINTLIAPNAFRQLFESVLPTLSGEALTQWLEAAEALGVVVDLEGQLNDLRYQNLTLDEKLSTQIALVEQLTVDFDGSAAATYGLSQAAAGLGQTMLQVAAAFALAKSQVQDITGSLINDLRRETLTPEELYNELRTDALAKANQILTAGSRDEVLSLVQDITNITREARNQLDSPDLNQFFIDFLNQVTTNATQRLDQLQTEAEAKAQAATDSANAMIEFSGAVAVFADAVSTFAAGGQPVIGADGAPASESALTPESISTAIASGMAAGFEPVNFSGLQSALSGFAGGVSAFAAAVAKINTTPQSIVVNVSVKAPEVNIIDGVVQPSEVGLT